MIRLAITTRVCAITFFLLAVGFTCQAQLRIPLTIQEALYPGSPTGGVARVQDPVTVGLPLPDSAGIKSISQLGLSGSPVGQFRILGRWPSGNAMWVLVDAQASLAGGGKNTSISLVPGIGDFGGSNLALDKGKEIIVNTGAAQFTIRKSRFNLFDRVVVHGKPLVESGSSQGLVVMGPDTTLTVAAPKQAPDLSSASGGSLPERPYYVRLSYATASGETEAGPEQRIAVSAGNLLRVASPPPEAHATGYYVYDSKAKDEETLQTPVAIAMGAPWSEPPSGRITNTRHYPDVNGVGTGCGVCDVPYSSNNDAHSTAIIEENGPARAVIKADGSHVDASGHAYMHYTVRMQFYKGKSYAKVEVILRNADAPAGHERDLNSAFKGFASYEARITPALTQPRAYSIGTDTDASVNGRFHARESAYLYQAYSDNMEFGDWRASNCPGAGRGRCVEPFITRTPAGPGKFTYAQDGYQIVAGDQLLAHKDHTRYPRGWADLSEAGGAGVEVGVYQLSAYWPKSLQFVDGGSEVRVGIWPDQKLFRNGQGKPYYQPWPEYSIHDLFFDFHDQVLKSPADTFLSFQHYLLARAPFDYYNRTGVLFYPLLDPGAEDRYFSSLDIHPLHDVAPKIFRYYAWPMSGSGNQHELRWSFLRNFLESGFTGRYIYAAQFYRMIAEHGFPRSDGFDWRDYPIARLDPRGFPAELPAANINLAYRNWIDDEHAHWYGMTNYYFMTGDETIKDQLLDGVKDRYLNPKSVYNTGHEWDTRDIGAALMAFARLYQALGAIRDPDAQPLLAVADQVLNSQVFPELQVSGFGNSHQGISRTRGVHFGCCAHDTEPGGFNGRVSSSFHLNILEEGLYELAQARGPSWPKYNLAMDLTYAMARWSLSESYGPAGTVPSEASSGWRYMLFIDQPNEGPKSWWYKPKVIATNWFHFFVLAAYSGDTSWRRDFDWYLQRTASNGDMVEFGSHMMQASMEQILHPPAAKLVSVPVTATSTGDGTYTLRWTLPAAAKAYRIKYEAGKNIVDWLDFNAGTGTFGLDPNKNWPWFAADDISSPPAHAQGPQTYHFHGTPRQTYTFAIKAEVPTSLAERNKGGVSHQENTQ